MKTSKKFILTGAMALTLAACAITATCFSNNIVHAENTDICSEGNQIVGSYNLTEYDYYADDGISVLSNHKYGVRLKYVDASDITEYTVPDGVNCISYTAFQDCTELEKITISDSVDGTINGLFNNLTNLTDVYIGSKVQSIGSIVNCPNLMNITVSSDNWTYSSVDGALYDKWCTQLKYYPAGKTSLDSIPSTVVAISSRAFDSSHIKNITIPGTIETVGCEAFNNCKKLESVVIPKSVTWISRLVFNGCDNLDSITYQGTEDAWNQDVFVESRQYANDANWWDTVTFDTVLIGDINMDGTVDVLDAVLLGKATTGSVTLSADQQANADCDGDGSITVNDTATLMQFLVRAIDQIG